MLDDDSDEWQNSRGSELEDFEATESETDDVRLRGKMTLWTKLPKNEVLPHWLQKVN